MALIWCLWLACTPQPDRADSAERACLERDPTVTVGTGAYEWEDLRDGDALTMVHGPQGGWHMLASLRVTSMVQVVEVDYTIRTAEGAVVSHQTYRVATLADGDCQGIYTGMYGYLDVSGLAAGEADTPPEVLAGEPLTLTLQVTDDEGRYAVATREVIATPDPADVD